MYTVSYGEIFLKSFKHYPANDRAKIQEFIEHYECHGLQNLSGRIKKSSEVSNDDPLFASKVSFANENNLWHYHIGIPEYDDSKNSGDWTSEYLLHYQEISNFEIKIVDFDTHPPFNLPSVKYLK